MFFLSLLLQTKGVRFITDGYTTIATPNLHVKFDKEERRGFLVSPLLPWYSQGSVLLQRRGMLVRRPGRRTSIPLA